MSIRIAGAREHNLKDVDVTFGDGLTVVTGVSGSGKSSLAFDTLYHEARRRFIEVFSPRAAALRMAPANVREVVGLGPAVAVGQDLLNRNPGSTVATASGLHPFLRLLYANFGERRCPRCGAGLTVLSEDEVVERIGALAQHGAVEVRAPLVRRAPGSHRTLLELLEAEFGAGALRVDGATRRPAALDPACPHDLDVLVATVAEADGAAGARVAVRAAAALGATAVTLRSDGTETALARSPVCAQCGAWFGELRPTHFHRTCPYCDGDGCERCSGTGRHPAAAAVAWQGLRLPELLARSVTEARALFGRAALPSSAARLLREVMRRLDALDRVGLGYLTLDRSSPTLSRGEGQRVRLAIALTGQLEDMLHVLDEPTVGLHPLDTARVLSAFRELAGPVVYVEHDRTATAIADEAVDLGPGAGREGGRLLYQGPPAGLWRADTPTGRFFSLRERVHVPARRPAPKEFVVVRGARLRNLRGVDVPIPLGRLTVVTGVSGSGKSTLVEDVLVASLSGGAPVGCDSIDGRAPKPVLVDQSPIGKNPRSNPATYTKLSDIIRDRFAAQTGLSASHFSFNRPEGQCPTCAGMGAVEVQMRYMPSTWITCADCDGQRFRDEVVEAKAVLGGRPLSIAELYELTIAEAAPLLAEGGDGSNVRRGGAARIIQAMLDIGLGYLSLGQPSPTLSGGEAQRVKLAKYLGRQSLAKSLLVLDEPSTGLHARDIAGLLVVLDRLVRAGATIVIVEHNTDVVRAADWVVDLGPGSGPEGGDLVYAGPLDGLAAAERSLTGRALREEERVVPSTGRAAAGRRPSDALRIRGARANNLRDVDVDFPKGKLTVVTGVSGSGKSSLVSDVLGAEAARRFFESLSVYERQGMHEGPEAPVGSVSGLGVAITIGPERLLYASRATVGTATEISHHLAVLLSWLGERACLECGSQTERSFESWHCPGCGADAPVAKPRHFSPSTYSAACRTCHGIGTLRAPNPDKLIVRPDLPLCGGAMYSPGFFPKGYLCKEGNGGYDLVQALAAHYGFDPAQTPWNEISPDARQAFLFGCPEPLTVTRSSPKSGGHQHTAHFHGFYGWVRDWDVGGTYTDTQVCPECGGARLRPEYLAVTLAGRNRHELSRMPFWDLAEALDALVPATGDGTAEVDELVATALQACRRRLRFLVQVGLGYLHLDREAGTLSAGEAQRIRLAGLLGSGLTSLTVLLDEPSRGLHPSEVRALCDALAAVRDEGNTVIVVEHDPVLIRAADYLLDLGPGAGAAGGEVVARGTPDEVARADTPTGLWLRGERRPRLPRERREPRGWLTIHGARAHNLRGDDVRLPLGVLVGVCGVSGSGKSTLLVDTLGRALAPRKQTTSVAYEPVEPGAHDAIQGAPARAIIVDQARAGVTSPAAFLGLTDDLVRIYAEGEDARALGLGEAELGRGCSACGGSGVITTDMGFLPDIHAPCETCAGTGQAPEAWDVRVRGASLAEAFSLTVEEALRLFGDEEALARPLALAAEVGLGYLVLRQPAWSLSGGEAQRLKIARELCRRTRAETLYLLDEPTIGQHLDDVERLCGVLGRLADEGHTVVVIEHHPHVLAACDWLLELGPGGGPRGGRVVAEGPPEAVAAADTATAPYLRQALEAAR